MVKIYKEDHVWVIIQHNLQYKMEYLLVNNNNNYKINLYKVIKKSKNLSLKIQIIINNKLIINL